MKGERVKTGIDLVGDVLWGTHLIQFYQTRKDWIETLVSFLQAGLEDNEFCLWVTSDPLDEKEAKKMMRKRISGFNQFINSKQFEIIPYSQWYLRNGKFNPKMVLHRWTEKLNQGVEKGLRGLRVAVDAGWVERKDQKRFTRYEWELDQIIKGHRMIVLCSYPIDQSRASEVLDLVNLHRTCVIKRKGQWELLESHRLKQKEEAASEQTEEALLKERQRFQALAGLLPYGLMIMDQEGRVKCIDSRFKELFGYDLIDLPDGRTWFKKAFPAPNSRREAILNWKNDLESLMQGEKKSRIFTVTCKDGTEKVVNMMTVYLESGEFLTACEDITERKRTEEALMKSEEKYRALFEESKDAIFITTAEGRFIDINPAGLKLFGYHSKDDLLEVDIAETFYFHPEDRENLKKLLAEQGFVKDYELNMKNRNGEKLTVLETATAVRNEEGKVVAYRGILRDVTEQKNLEQQYLQSQKMEAIGILAGGVAHDFNNLLMVIQGNVELALLEIDRSHPIYEIIMKIREGARKASDLTQQLLSFSRRRILHPRILNVADLIGDLSKMLTRMIGEDIELRIEFGQNLGHIYVDPNALDQVLMNLVVNARNAMPQGGSLFIQAQNTIVDESFCRRHPDFTPGEYVQISVIDTGVGMDENTLQRIFEPFFTTREQGTGLGLATVYGIIKQHQGHIQVSSQLGRGSRFDIFLPLHRESLVHEVLESEERTFPRGRETILLAEDEKDDRELLSLFLESLGYTVITARDGQEALDLFSMYQDEVDIAILDGIMPKLNGPQVFEQMKILSPNLKCLFLTGYSEEIVQRYFNQELEVPMLRKPITFQELGRKIREILD